MDEKTRKQIQELIEKYTKRRDMFKAARLAFNIHEHYDKIINDLKQLLDA